MYPSYQIYQILLLISLINKMLQNVARKFEKLQFYERNVNSLNFLYWQNLKMFKSVLALFLSFTISNHNKFQTGK